MPSSSRPDAVSRDVAASSLAGRLKVLTEEKCRGIYEASLRILAEVGMTVPHQTARRLLLDAGAAPFGKDIVRIPGQLVEKARETVPATIPVCDRNGAPAMELGRFNAYFGTGSDLMHIYDLETGEHRASRLSDVGLMARLSDALPDIDFVMSSAYPREVTPALAYLECFRQMVANTTKPLVVTAAGAGDLEVMWAIACELRGGGEGLRERPYFVQYGEPVSPLMNPVEVLDKLLFCADHGIPLIFAPAPTAGATAPMTHAGQIAQGLAECLFGLVVHQLRAPGSPFIAGSAPAKLDMLTLQQLYNSAERYTADLGLVEMTKWLDIPNWGFAGTSDAHAVDVQAGIDATMGVLLSMQAGSNLNHDVGYLGFGLTCGPELIVIVDEIVAMARRALAGIEVDEESLALDLIAATGPGGEYLRSRHTRRHTRELQWRPTVFNRLARSQWEAEGSLDLREKARRKARAILAEHEPAPLPPAVWTRMDELIDAYSA